MISRVQGPWTALELHTLGWKAFQDLCAQVCEEVLHKTVSLYREAQDGGQDAVFLTGIAGGQNGIGTVQCKFTSEARRRLRFSDLSAEEETVRNLVVAGEATTYVLMTNMGVDAPIAARLRSRLSEIGVKFPHVLGNEFLTWSIRRSARLRALVPRVYGLGDLSMILDERRAAQTKKLLGHLIDTLRVYVPTEAHRIAVRCLADQGIVLLLGEPATGKSTIAAILATTMSEGHSHEGVKCEGPLDLVNQWNPYEGSKFYWIDDAFGATQLRADYIDTWISIIPKVQAAIVSGNRFALTSRRHIYESAKPKLGTRNHPAFRDQRAIVDVGVLTEDERRQMLYNHIKAGNQLPAWKASVSSHLDAIAADANFIPEIARRLADPLYTPKLGTSRAAILSFVRAPKPHLIEVIEELARVHQAALALVYIHRGQLPAHVGNDVTWELVATTFGTDPISLGEALLELDRSFIVRITDGAQTRWTFKHPTIIDALSEILGKRPELTELFLRGAHWRDITTEVICTGMGPIKDAISIPDSQVNLLATRLREIPDEPDANRALYEFLATRASEGCLRSVLQLEPALFDRNHRTWFQISVDPKMKTATRVHRLGLLTDVARTNSVEHLRIRLSLLDASFLEGDELLALFEPRSLLEFAVEVRNILRQLPDHAKRIEEETVDHYGVRWGFNDYSAAIQVFEDLFNGDDSVSGLLRKARSAMEKAKRRLNKRFPEPIPLSGGKDLAPSDPKPFASFRSIFSDLAD